VLAPLVLPVVIQFDDLLLRIGQISLRIACPVTGLLVVALLFQKNPRQFLQAGNRT
jgi:hypothetical protein